MSEAVSALNMAGKSGLVDVAEAGLVGMVTIRGDVAADGLRGAISAATGLSVPETRRIEANGADKLLWMSPDELLLVCPHAEADARVLALSGALSGQHHLVANVSDARAVFHITGRPGAIRDTLAKLTPADMSRDGLPVGEIRRTRLAQVPAAIWFDEDERATVVCFRSVAQYVFDLITNAANPKAPVDHF